MTPLGIRNPGEEESKEYFGEVDFVEDDEEVEEVEEGEMRKIVWGRVGGWVDWAVGWMDFRREGEDGEEAEEVGVEAKKREEVVRRRKRDEGDRILVARVEDLRVNAPPSEGEGALSDAKWLLDVARKVLV